MQRLLASMETMILGVGVLIGMPALGQAQSRTDFLGKSLAEWVRELDSSDPALRRAAVFALGNKGSDAAPWTSRLKGLLEDPDETVREAAAFALGKIGPPASVSAQTLLETRLAKDPSPIVRRSAAFALGAMGQAGASSANALVRALDDADPRVRQNAAFALGQLGPDVIGRHTRQVAALLKDGDALVRRDAAVALGQGGPASAAAVPDLILALDDADTGVRLNAALALGNIGPQADSALPALTRVIRDRLNDRDVWREAVIAVPKIGSGDADDLLPALRPALKDADPRVRKSAALALFKNAESPAARGCLTDAAGLLQDEDVEVRRMAAAFLSVAMKSPDPAHEPVWQPLLDAIQKEPDFEVRLFLARSFKGFDLADPSRAEGRTVLIRLALNDKYPVVRYQLAYFLAMTLGRDARDVTPTLIALLKDKSISLVEKTEGASQVQGGEARGGGTRIAETGSGDARILGAAGLGCIGKAAGPAAQRALEEAARDPKNPENLRSAAREALNNFR